MEFLGVGPLEIVFILILALIVLGPDDMAKAGRTLGRTLRKIVMSPTWQAVNQTWRTMRYLPNRLMREAGLEDEINDLKQTQAQLKREVEEMRKIGAPLDAAAREINQEAHSLQSGLNAWTTQAPEPPPAPDQGAQQFPENNPNPQTEPPSES